MADFWEEFYSSVDPNKPYVSTPGAIPGGIDPSQSSGLITRSVKSWPVDERTGFPLPAIEIGGQPRSVQNATGPLNRGGPASSRNSALAQILQLANDPRQPKGSINPYASTERLNSPEYAFAYGAAPSGGFSGNPRGNRGYNPTPMRVAPNPGDGGLFGIPMSAGMEAILAKGQNRQMGPFAGNNITVGGSTQALAQALMGQTPVQQLQAQGYSPSQAYSAANAQASQRAISNSSNPSANAARASLASQWGFD